jgi:sodium/potassium/calcium exchanger 6
MHYLQFQDVVQSLKSTSTRFNNVRRRNPSSPSHNQQQPFANRAESTENYRDDLSLHTAESTQNGPAPPLSSYPRSKLLTFINQFFNSTSTRYIRKQIRRQLFPTLIGFRKKSIFSKVSSILSLPVIFLLATTLPVVKENALVANSAGGLQLDDATAELLEDYDDENEDIDQANDMLVNTEETNWLKWLTAVQLIGAPILISFVLITQDVFSAAIVLPIASVIGSLVTIAFWLTTSASKQPRLYWMMCFIGFGIAVVWIFLIANEVVSVLQAIGMAVGVSEAILGLTIFALVCKKRILNFKYIVSLIF